jgi:hypothetical protein
MDQSLVSDASNRSCAPLGPDSPVTFRRSDFATGQRGHPFVAIVRTQDEFLRWLSNPLPGLQWLQVEGLLGDPGVWAQAAHSDSQIPLDVHLAAPGSGYSDLYKLVDVRVGRDVRVTLSASLGILKAVKLAAALRLPVRILPGQPGPDLLAELAEALTFYLRDPMVETPVEFFHSALAFTCGTGTDSLWTILEEDPALFRHESSDGVPELPRAPASLPQGISLATFVESRFQRLVDENAECATCPWQRICQGYFKWPDSAYSCAGVKQLFSAIDAAADEIGRELASRDWAHADGAPRIPGSFGSAPAGSGP